MAVNRDQLRSAIQATIASDSVQRNAAEEFLKTTERQPGYIITLLELVQQAAAPADAAIRLSASVQFKNFVRKYPPVFTCLCL